MRLYGQDPFGSAQPHAQRRQRLERELVPILHDGRAVRPVEARTDRRLVMTEMERRPDVQPQHSGAADPKISDVHRVLAMRQQQPLLEH